MAKSFTVRDLPKTERPREITRQCAICGKDILIKVFPSGRYIGGNYFSTIEEAENYHDTGETFDLGNGYKAHIVEPVGKIKKWEYWECDECYRNWKE